MNSTPFVRVYRVWRVSISENLLRQFFGEYSYKANLLVPGTTIMFITTII